MTDTTNTSCWKHKIYGLLTALFVAVLIIYLVTTSTSFGRWKIAILVPWHAAATAPLQVQYVETTDKSSRQKLILLWTAYFGDQSWSSHFNAFDQGRVRGEANSSENLSCLVTVNRELVEQAHAVVFHGRDFNFNDVPKERAPSQRWIYYNMESPLHSGFDAKRWALADRLRLNWSMTYHRKSDVWVPYTYVVPKEDNTEQRPDEQKMKSFIEGFTRRPKDAVWIASNCNTPSRREILVDRLKENGIGVDSFGVCGEGNLGKILEEMGESAFFSRYKFYLAFENSLCEDYITEKFARALENSLKYGVLPIVYGSSDYSRIAPEGSFIQSESFASVKQLAAFLHDLRTKPGMAASYYGWHVNYTHVTEDYGSYGFRNVCKKMFIEQKFGCRSNPAGDAILEPCQPVHSSIHDLKSTLGSCHETSLFSG